MLYHRITTYQQLTQYLANCVIPIEMLPATKERKIEKRLASNTIVAFRCNFCQYFKRPQTTAHTLQHPHSKPKKNPFDCKIQPVACLFVSRPRPFRNLFFVFETSRTQWQLEQNFSQANFFTGHLTIGAPTWRPPSRHFGSTIHPGENFPGSRLPTHVRLEKFSFLCVPHVPRAVEINF